MVMDKLDYVNKVNSVCCTSDAETYEVMREDPTKKMQVKMNKLLKKCKEQGYLEKKLYQLLMCTKGSILRMYGNPKVHKNGIPLKKTYRGVLYIFYLPTF